MQPFRLVLLLCMTVSLAMWQTGSAAADGGGRATVQSIEVTAEHVTIHLSSASVYTQAALPRDPLNGRADRCYVDIGGVLGQQVERWHFGDAHRVERVRAAQFQPQTVRVVLDLLTAQPCRVEQAVNPDRLLVIVGRSTPPAHATRARLSLAEPPTQTVRPEAPPEQQVDQVARQESAAEPQTSGALEYLDLRTAFSSETQPAQAISIFDQQTTEGTTSQLSLLDQQTPEGATSRLSLLGRQTPEGAASQFNLFSQQAIDEQALQLAPRGLYLLQEKDQESGSSVAPRLEW